MTAQPPRTNPAEPAAPAPTSAIAPDCRHYRGDRPCIANRLCAGCASYSPYAHRIVIIKLGALGDVIRTLCLLPELRRLHPQAHLTWVSLPSGCRMIEGHPMIDRVMAFDAITALVLQHERFDLLINLDKEPQPCALAMSLTATRKLGVGLSPHGTPVPLNPEAEHYFHLGLSDELKFHENRKSYQRLVYEAMGLDYRGQRYELPLSAECVAEVRGHLRSLGWREQVTTLGVNVGAGKVFANKMWPAERQVELIARLLRSRGQLQMLLLGGPGERAIIDEIKSGLAARGIADAAAIDPGTDFSEPRFVALVDACDVLFSGDTMAMHVAVALGKRTVVCFGPTCEQEIDLFGQGEKLVAEVDCGPCYKRVCDRSDRCIHAVPVDAAAEAIGRQLDAARGRVGMGLPVLQPLRHAG